MVDQLIRSWALGEIAFWKARRVGYELALKEYRHYNDTRRHIFLFRLDPDRVTVADKPAFYSRNELDQPSRDPSVSRAQRYMRYLEHICRSRCPDVRTTVAFDVSDMGFSSDTAPIFVFQKPSSRGSLLFPDIDFINHNFYLSKRIGQLPYREDTLPYAEKNCMAVFAGATTGGGLITLERLRRAAVPRVRAAMFFRGSALVDFRLPRIVQCTPEAEKMIRDAGFGTGLLTWIDQHQYKFLISMDGNGATCSRVVIGLKSNSVLVKYNSSKVLFYFKGLLPWFHYIPVSSDEQVTQIVDMEKQEPGLFEYIARNGQEFARKYLNQKQIGDYAACLIRMYAASFNS